MSSPVISRSSLSANIVTCKIYGNNGGEVNLIPGIYDLRYYESILQDSVKATLIYIDSRGTIKDTTVLEGLPIVGQEKVELEITDNADNKKKVTLYVNSAHPQYNDQNKQMIALD